ncbi:hypothetical protein PR202_gb05840 [Eleusine coracana subsp. coracana]|uniref:Uncharacterized protein n=1 Tax=Eleusine coracana subsp. coracana TaxID=191504 RepID=A0AAV5E862_ELECO|nr:hypothetical protein PR202_gb05840 [Eleusine coracana subsp. coracana]
MGEAKDNEVYEEDLVDYEEEVENSVNGAAANASADVVKKYVMREDFLYCRVRCCGEFDLTGCGGQGLRGDPQLGVQRLPPQARTTPCNPGLRL